MPVEKKKCLLAYRLKVGEGLWNLMSVRKAEQKYIHVFPILEIISLVYKENIYFIKEKWIENLGKVARWKDKQPHWNWLVTRTQWSQSAHFRAGPAHPVE